MPVVTCPCGTRLKAPDHPKGGRAKCPKCGQPVIVPPATPKRPVGAAAQPAGVSAERAKASAEPAEEAAPLELLEKLMSASPADSSAAATSGARIASAGAQATGAADPESIELLYDLADGEAVTAAAPRKTVQPVQQPRTAGYARDEFIAASAKPRGALADATSGPRRGFWLDAAHAYAYPFASIGNGITAVILMIVGVVRLLVYHGPGLLPGGRLVIYGWVCWWGLRIMLYGWMASVYLRIVSETAAGNDDLPGIELSGSWLDDILYPALTYFLTFVLAMVPNIAYYILVLSGILDPNTVLLTTWTLIGIFLWPMFMLLFALGVWRMIFRPDLILMTVAQSFPAYAAVWGALLISSSLMVGQMVEDVFLQFGVDPFAYLPDMFQSFWGGMGLEVIYVYLTIVSMRIIGLYYLHFKRKFAFKLE